jgi:L-ascorbate metabolism protein UlaG (beta-lactamase superfamily)
LRITYYGQNAFRIEAAGKRILIDPGRSLSSFRSLVPRNAWPGADVILVTHRDADHFAFVPKIASQYGAEVVCSRSLAVLIEKKGIEGVHYLTVGERAEVQGFEILGVPALHGPGKAGDLDHKTQDSKGSIGYSFNVERRTVVNLGDTVLLEAWRNLEADILMVPVGGFFTMNRKEAAKAVRLIRPATVIPTHFHWKLGPYVHPARVTKFAREVSSQGINCVILRKGESIEL